MSRYSPMANSFENRRVNLRQLVEQWGGPLPLSRKLGYKNASFISQMAGPNPTREVTEKTARRFEKDLGLPNGWLDLAHDATVTPTPAQVDVTLVARIVRAVAQTAEDEHIVLNPDKLGDVVALVYGDAEHNNGEVSQEFINRVLRLTQ